MKRKKYTKRVTGLLLAVWTAAAFLAGAVRDAGRSPVMAAGYEEAYLDTLNEYTIPEWWRDAKFGIFIHYGVYAVPAFGDEWYPKWMYIPNSTAWGGSSIYQYHEETYGSVALGEGHGYKQFIPAFSEGVKKFSDDGMAQQWAELFAAAGAKYVMPVGIHHDGFALYDSDVQKTYNTVSQAGVDYIAQLQKAVKANGMKFGISNHFAENDGYYEEDKAPEGADIRQTKTTPDELYGDGKSNSEWHINRWYNISMEIINKYDPDIIYYDYGINYDPYNRLKDANRYKMLAEFYQKAKKTNPEGVVCNYKEGGFLPSQATFNKERSSLADINPVPFQTDTSIGTKSWGYTTDEVFRSADDCIKALIDVVSKNGNFLLNVGPMPDGTIPEGAKETLLTIGDWLSRYGDAIYATRPWVKFGEGPTGTSYDNYNFTVKDIRFTESKDHKKLYAIVMGRPIGDAITIKTLNADAFGSKKIGAVRLLNGEAREELVFEQDAKALSVKLPSDYLSRLKGPFAMEITMADGSMIPAVPMSAADHFETSNYSDAAGTAVAACPYDGTDMLIASKGTEAYAVYNISMGDSWPEVFLGNFSGDSEGTVEFYLGGKGGKKIGELALSAADDGAYRTERAVLDLRDASGDRAELTVVLNGDIRFNSFKLLTRNPGETIEAEAFDEKSGSVRAETTKDSKGGGENLGYVQPGDWVRYSDVNFADGVREFTMRYASQGSADLEVRLDAADGPVAVATNAAATGGWDSYKTATGEVSAVDGKPVTGRHDVYLVFRSTMNLNWFLFAADTPPATEPETEEASSAEAAASETETAEPDSGKPTEPGASSEAASQASSSAGGSKRAGLLAAGILICCLLGILAGAACKKRRK